MEEILTKGPETDGNQNLILENSKSKSIWSCFVSVKIEQKVAYNITQNQYMKMVLSASYCTYVKITLQRTGTLRELLLLEGESEEM